MQMCIPHEHAQLVNNLFIIYLVKGFSRFLLCEILGANSCM